MTARQEITAVTAALAGSGVVLLVREPALGLAVLAGSGAAALLQPRGRTALAVLLGLLGAGLVAVGLTRPDAVLAGAAAVATAAAGFAAVRSRRWPPPRRAAAVADGEEPSARDTWDALDRGEDPTT